MLVLGIETSCDETAAALVTDGREICANIVLSQLDEHAPYGGIVPEIAARSHIEHLDGVIARAMKEAGTEFGDLDGVAATAGPGLIGSVMVGLMTGKAVAAVHDLPLAAVNHLEGHALSARLSDADLQFPYLLLLVSGGHCQFLAVEGVAQYRRLGTTIDDAAGEAFDKAAKLLGLGYPGGPAIARAAKYGDGARYDLPRPLKGRKGCDFSFSGLKTALLHKVRALEIGLDDTDRADLAAAFQQAVADVVIDRGKNAIREFLAAYTKGRALDAAGGVASRHGRGLPGDAEVVVRVAPLAVHRDQRDLLRAGELLLKQVRQDLIHSGSVGAYHPEGILPLAMLSQGGVEASRCRGLDLRD